MTSLNSGQECLWHLSGPAGMLEVLYMSSPQSDAALAIIAHPHPLGGGTMRNKVVSTLMRFYRDKGVHVLRFNFRGVENSAGQHAHGIGEQEDLVCVFNAGCERIRPQGVYLAGFSFGSYVAAAVACRSEIQKTLSHLLLVAPPVDNYPFHLDSWSVPTWVVQGDQDELVSVASVRHWVQQQSPSWRYEELSGCGHFFHGQLPELTKRLQKLWA